MKTAHELFLGLEPRCVVAHNETTGQVVIDRSQLHDPPAKNMRNRYQLLSCDQNECQLFRSRRQVLTAFQSVQ